VGKFCVAHGYICSLSWRGTKTAGLCIILFCHNLYQSYIYIKDVKGMEWFWVS
jgi:hypothetical protein